MRETPGAMVRCYLATRTVGQATSFAGNKRRFRASALRRITLRWPGNHHDSSTLHDVVGVTDVGFETLAPPRITSAEHPSQSPEQLRSSSRRLHSRCCKSSSPISRQIPSWINGPAGRDWFLSNNLADPAGPLDRITDLASNEVDGDIDG